MNKNDVQQLQYTLSKAQARNEELKLALSEREGQVAILTDLVISHEMEIRKSQEQLAAANARIAELEAQVAAVPVEAIQEAHRFCASVFHPTANLDVMFGEWWKPFVSWVDAQAQAQP